MPTIDDQIVVAASPERIFALLGRPERGPEWTPNLLRVEPAADGAAGAGAESRVVVKVGTRESRGTGRLVEWDPPRRMVAESQLDIGLKSLTSFTVEPVETGSRLIARLEYTLALKGFGRLLAGMFGESFARRDLNRALVNLKSLVESEASAANKSVAG